ncbi:MAG TPA: hypothetical protein PLT86_13460, partial [Candidatus Latescibacteria bacterium]|nr:hypothetical protein [Candidatus Latescibacterota bacterium]
MNTLRSAFLFAACLCAGSYAQAPQEGAVSERQRASKLLQMVIGTENFARLSEAEREDLLSGRVFCATDMLRRTERNRSASRPAITQGITRVGDSFFAGKKYRLILIYITPASGDTAKPLLVRNSFLPGRVPNGGSSTRNWTQSDTLDLAMYTKEAIQYLIGQYTYGELDTSDFRIDIPVPNGVTPIWRSQGDSGTAVVDSVLRRIEDTYPPGDPGADYFALPAGYDYQRVGYVFVDKYDGLDTNAFAMSSEDNETWTGSVGQAIWNGATFAAATQWSGTSCGMWADRHSETGVGIIFHELLHHLIYACSENPLLGDRGIWDKHTRTWGFDVMDHNGGKPEPTNGHYGVPPLSPIDQYMLGFIKSAWYAEITNNSTDVRIRPRTTVLSPSSTDKLLYRIPMNEANVESFVISNHQGTGIDEVYNEGLGDTLTRGLQIWHISPLFRLAGGTATADVEVAWTLALGDTFRHPDGSRTWLVGDYLDSTHYHENLDWVDCSNLTDSPLYPAPAGKSLHIIQGAWGGYSCGTPGDSHGYYNNENGRSTWQFDTFTGNPTRNDFFTACKEFTPYTAPSTDTYHLYRADNVVGAADDCSGLRQLDPPREGALYTNSSPTGTHIALVNIRQEAGGDMLFDVYFNFWEGNFSHAKNFGAASTGYWGQEYDNTDTVVVGPNGFVVDSSRTLTIRSATTVRCLGGITVHGTLTVQSGVFFDTIKGDIVIASGGRLELGSNVT